LRVGVFDGELRLIVFHRIDDTKGSIISLSARQSGAASHLGQLLAPRQQADRVGAARTSGRDARQQLAEARIADEFSDFRIAPRAKFEDGTSIGRPRRRESCSAASSEPNNAAVSSMKPLSQPESLQRAYLAFAEALVTLSGLDLPYSDFYLDLARTGLEPAFSEAQYRALSGERDALPGLAKQLHQLAERGEWSKVRSLARQGAWNRQHIIDSERLLSLGDAVYGPRMFRASAIALALNGILVQPTSQLARARADCIAGLNFLLAHDPEMQPFYRARLTRIERLDVVADPSFGSAAEADDLSRGILEAADQGDFARVERLSAVMVDMVPANRPARVRALDPATGPAEFLVAELPHTAVQRAAAVGLTAVTLASDDTLYEHLRSYGDERMLFPDRPLGEPERADADPLNCNGDRAMPTSSKVHEVLELLRLHAFITSAGTRYLPHCGPEILLVETFPESEPDTHTELLDALGLPRRRKLSRLTIESAVRSRTGRICSELGLDPAAYVVVPIPFDAYLRLAPRFCWGRERLWTHFDGYQVTRELHFRALVGGDAGYGGAEDLCGVGRDYEVDRIVARFAIVRRERFASVEPVGNRAARI
jgi:hypothetical protein